MSHCTFMRRCVISYLITFQSKKFGLSTQTDVSRKSIVTALVDMPISWLHFCSTLLMKQSCSILIPCHLWNLVISLIWDHTKELVFYSSKIDIPMNTLVTWTGTLCWNCSQQLLMKLSLTFQEPQTLPLTTDTLKKNLIITWRLELLLWEDHNILQVFWQWFSWICGSQLLIKFTVKRSYSGLGSQLQGMRTTNSTSMMSSVLE